MVVVAWSIAQDCYTEDNIEQADTQKVTVVANTCGVKAAPKRQSP
jgi:hypothetical protein